MENKINKIESKVWEAINSTINKAQGSIIKK